MYTIAKRFAFSASHIIGGLPDEHPCGRLHGHNYEVEVVLQSATLDPVGFVRDHCLGTSMAGNPSSRPRRHSTLACRPSCSRSPTR
jgi:hypothetical protein